MNIFSHHPETCPCCILKRAENATARSSIEDYDAFAQVGQSLYEFKELNDSYLEKIAMQEVIIANLTKEIIELRRQVSQMSDDPN